MTYSFGFVEMCHLNVAPVMVGEVKEVEGEADPEVKTRHPHEDSVLKALGEVGIAGVPRDVPLLQTQTQAWRRWEVPQRGGARAGSKLAVLGFNQTGKTPAPEGLSGSMCKLGSSVPEGP